MSTVQVSPNWKTDYDALTALTKETKGQTLMTPDQKGLEAENIALHLCSQRRQHV